MQCVAHNSCVHDHLPFVHSCVTAFLHFCIAEERMGPTHTHLGLQTDTMHPSTNELMDCGNELQLGHMHAYEQAMVSCVSYVRGMQSHSPSCTQPAPAALDLASQLCSSSELGPPQHHSCSPPACSVGMTSTYRAPSQTCG